jgi:hypothetical protein
MALTFIYTTKEVDMQLLAAQEDLHASSEQEGGRLAVCGKPTAAMNIYREHLNSLLSLSKQGYRIRMTGHSLDGDVAPEKLFAFVYETT